MQAVLKRQNAPDLAYNVLNATNKGQSLPTIMFLGGFRSDMEGTKALYLEEQCKIRGQAYIRMDYRGHGCSGGVFEEACISEWAQDAQDILDALTNGPVILVGSSMGGWISLLLSLKNPEKIVGLIGLAAAPDFTKWMEDAMSEVQKSALMKEGFFALPNDYDDVPYIISKKLIEDGRQNLLLDKKLNIKMPVRLIQGKQDADVPWQTAQRIKDAIQGSDVEIIYIEDADHRLSTPEQLKIIDEQVAILSRV